jgi:tetratricopeptide (TPR) repeat protein
MRLGLYRDAVARNAEAATVDERYLEHRDLSGEYHGYYLHNIHFLWAALMMEGRNAETQAAGRRLVTVERDHLKKISHVELFYASPILGMARFGRWDEIMREPAPSEDMPFVRGLWHYARGLAQAATGRLNQAETEQGEIAKVAKNLPKDRTVETENLRQVLKVAEKVLSGEVAAKRKRYNDAIRLLTEAVAIESALRYSEPPLWYSPVQQHLGAVLLEAGRPSEAERVYLSDLKRHPENGWSLFGLAQSLRAQNRMAEAAAAEHRFKQAWARADVTLTASRF